MRRIEVFSILVMGIIVLFVAGCQVQLPIDSQSGGLPTSAGEEITLYVGPQTVECEGAGPQTCLLVKTDPDGDYGLFYDQIEGFDYEPGYDYELRVQVDTVPNPPADASSLKYTLIEVVSKSPAQDGDGTTADGVELEGTPWKLDSYADGDGQLVDVAPGAEITALFENGSLTGNSGCNAYFGSYVVDGNALEIAAGGGTMMACPEALMIQEQAYMMGLGSVAAFEIDGNRLTLSAGNGGALLVYSVLEPTSLTATNWEVIGYNNGKQAVVSVIIGTRMTAIFGEDGVVTGLAGCNNYSATYETEGETIQIGPAAATRKMCAMPEGVMEQEAQYLQALEMAEVYSIESDRLQLRTSEGSLVADFRALPAIAESAPEEVLANMTYQSEWTADGTAPLTDGQYSEAAAPGSASMTTVSLIGLPAYGMLNGEPSVAVVLVTQPGGSGSFYDLAVVQEEGDEPVNIATVQLGDRVKVEALAIEENLIIVRLVTQGPDDPMCCPTQQLMQTYALQDDQLVQRSSQLLGSVQTESAQAPEMALAGPELTPEVLANTEYKSEFTDSGVALLTDGEYREAAAPGSATQIIVKLTDHVANGQLNDEAAAAVVLVTDPGGSGTFYDLAVVANRNGVPTNIAITMLGDRVQVQSLGIENSEIMVEMVTQGPDDPMCCPTQHVVNRYIVQGDQLIQTASDVVESAPEMQPIFRPETARAGMVTLNPQEVATTYHWRIMPATPYDESTPPGPTGTPAHIAVTFDSEPPEQVADGSGRIVRIYPVAEYGALWEEAGNASISQTVDQLALLLADRPAQLQGPLPVLPPQAGLNDVAAQTGYLDFSAGSGIKFVGRFSQDMSPISGEQLHYIYQGLTDDGRFYISLFYPVLPGDYPASAQDLSAAQQEQVNDDFEAYLQTTLDTLNAIPTADWTPDLAALDALVESLTINVAPSPSDSDFAGVYSALLPAASSPGRQITLELASDGTATMSTDYMNGEPPIVEVGNWQDNGNGTATGTLTGRADRAYDEPVVTTFALEGDQLTATEYDESLYGAEGLNLKKQE